jgi:FkbM family methyltransferase
VGGAGHVHAIEPTKYARTKLMQNLSLNPELARRITVHNYLITNEHDPNPRREIKSSWRSTHLVRERADEAVDSPTISIDDLARSIDLERCDFLKIDIDGYDLKAIQGATQVLEKFSPQIFIELCDRVLRENDTTVVELAATLNKLGYDGVVVETGDRVTKEFLSGINPNASLNGLFAKAGRGDRLG